MMEGTVLRTPRRCRRSLQREGNLGRRRSLFSESRDSDDDIATLSPTSSEVGSAANSPVVAVKNLENNFTQLLLNKTPMKSHLQTPLSPRIKGVTCLSEDTDVIKKNSFYGNRCVSLPPGLVDGKSLWASVRSSVPMKARTRLFPEDTPKEKKKRARTASFLDSVKRAKKKPRLQESLPCASKLMLMQKLNKLKGKIALEKEKRRKIKLELQMRRAEGQKKSLEDAQFGKRKYNWEIFTTGGEKRFFKSLNSSVTMTPPSTNKKKRLMRDSDMDNIVTPTKQRQSSDSDDDREGLIEEIKKDVIAMMQDEDKDVKLEVNKLLFQLDQSTELDAGLEDDFAENRDPNVPETPRASEAANLAGTPTSSTPTNSSQYYSVFNRTPSSSTSVSSSSSLSVKSSSVLPTRGRGLNQMLLDCGQSSLRELECPTCQLVYVQGVAEDEARHLKYHSALTQMKYNGFKNERVVGLRMGGFEKVILIRQQGDDHRVWKMALDFKRVVDAELGSPSGDPVPDQVYLYIKNRQVVGLLAAVIIKEAYRMLTLSEDVNVDPNLPSLCSQESYPAKCGITRVWVRPTARKEGIASAMTDALRRNFMFGVVLNLDDIAMSSPTADGRLFAMKYFKRNDFLVY